MVNQPVPNRPKIRSNLGEIPTPRFIQLFNQYHPIIEAFSRGEKILPRDIKERNLKQALREMEVVYKMNCPVPLVAEGQDDVQKLLNQIDYEIKIRYFDKATLYGDIQVVWPMKILHFQEYAPKLNEFMDQIQSDEELTGLLKSVITNFESIITQVLPHYICKNILWSDHHLEMMRFLNLHGLCRKEGLKDWLRFTDPRYGLFQKVQKDGVLENLILTCFETKEGASPEATSKMIIPHYALRNQEFMGRLMKAGEVDYALIDTNSHKGNKFTDGVNLFYFDGQDKKATWVRPTIVEKFLEFIKQQKEFLDILDTDSFRSIHNKANGRLESEGIPMPFTTSEDYSKLTLTSGNKIMVNLEELPTKGKTVDS